jgi:ankyrin repeat protein
MKSEKRTLTQSLIKQEKFDELIDLYSKDIDEPDEVGNTLLMYATINQKTVLIEKLIKLKADPFKSDKFGNSAFSISLKHGREDLAQKFLLTKISDILQSQELTVEITPHLYSSENGDLSYYIASHICKSDSTLREILHFDIDTAQTCFSEAREYCETLGQDSTNLLVNNDFI